MRVRFVAMNPPATTIPAIPKMLLGSGIDTSKSTPSFLVVLPSWTTKLDTLFSVNFCRLPSAPGASNFEIGDPLTSSNPVLIASVSKKLSSTRESILPKKSNLKRPDSSCPFSITVPFALYATGRNTYSPFGTFVLISITSNFIPKPQLFAVPALSLNKRLKPYFLSYSRLVTR